MIFLLGKLVWIVASPGNFLALMLAAGTLWLVVSRRRSHGKAAAMMTCFALLSVVAMMLGRETRDDALPQWP